MALTTGIQLGPYEILSPLGAGGMGEVYRATDTKLGRDVALKVLPAEMAQDPERLARFRREAKVLAQLDHPNIVTIHSVEEANGVHFLTMQLVEGLPLDRLIPAGGLPVEQIVEIASALGDALAAAHEKGIVHRDLKPANVMVSNEGRVKVLDFGLAKDVSASDPADATLTSDHRTQAGMVMGTPAYMSPEQTSGRPLDHRTDIFSMGVLLHEMATGRRPFEGSSSAELVSAILRDNPPSVTDARPDLPSDLARIVRRCLEKDPRHRVQTARDVSNEFRDLARQTSQKFVSAKTSTARAVAPADSGGVRADEGFWVAVLPFRYGGGNTDLAALADGLTDDIVTNMSKFSYLRVVAHGSTAQYAQRTVDVRTAAKELGARYVMEGSIRQAGTKVRIAVQLVDANAGSSLWADTYDRPFTAEEMLDVLDDVVPRIVATIGDAQGILAHSMTEALRHRDPESLTPYEALLRSFGFHQHVSEDEHLAGITALERAVKKAPDHADCWAMLSWLYRAEYTHGYHARPDSMDRSLTAARCAVNLAPSSQLAHAALASAHFFRGELGEFRAAAERALALNRMQGYTTAFLGLHFAYSGEWERGCALAERATQLNPNHPGWYWLPLVINAYRQHDGERALQHALKINMPGLWTAQVALTVVNSQLGKVDQARSALRALLAARPDFVGRAQEDLSIWWQPELVEQMLGDLSKAGFTPSGATVLERTSSVSFPAKTSSGERRANGGFWVAVLPFRGASGDADLEALADGLTEDVTTGFSRFPYLQVIAHNSAMAYKGRAADIRTVGRELGARYVIEGSIRKRGRAIRISAQLMDAVSGTQLWAETYDRQVGDREMGDAGTFQVQDDLTDHIVTTVADGYGVLVRSMAAPTRNRKVEELSASELVLRYYAFMQQVNLQEHALLRAGLERALEREPHHPTAWACLSNLYQLEYFDRFNPREKPLERAREAAWRAVKIDPACQMGWKELAAVHFFSRDFIAFRETAERAISLNPRDGTTLAFMALMIAFSGEWERGVALAQRAIDLNRHHPGWYHNILFHHHYRKREYEAALQAAKKINMPEFHWMHLMTAAACGMLGRHEEARTAIEALRKYSPTFLDLENVREDIEMWDPDKDEVEQLLQGLQKAGLKYGVKYGSADSAATDSIATNSKETDSKDTKPEPKLKSDPAAASSASIATTTASGASRAALREEEGFWVAVLPFKYTGDNRDLKALAEGLTEEVTTGLSRFSYLRVIARGSTTKYSSESVDVRTIGKELGARYVMEASVRHAGNKLRLAVQLVEATTGSHLWAETYERGFTPESGFEIQDDLVPRIVSTVADAHGILPHTLGESIRGRNPEQLSPYEAVLRGFSYAERISPEEHAVARTALERAVELAPHYAYAWAMLALTIKDEYESGFNPKPDPLERMLHAARRAVELDPSGHRGYHALALAHFYRREIQAFRTAADRAVALNPMDGCNVAHLGSYIAYAGEWERGCDLVERALQLNPNHPGWFWFPLSFNACRKGDYHGALGYALKINLPNFLWTHMTLAMVYGQLGQHEKAANAVRELLKLNPHAAQMAGPALQRIFEPEFVEQVIGGLRKAGLHVPSAGGTSVAIKTSESGAVRADEGFWVAVLPFKYASVELKALADGLSEEIVTGLSRFSYLRVIARSSTAKYFSESGDIRAIGKELGARYVMEGSLRQAGSKLRLAVQLVDTVSGTHLWAENYEHTFSPENFFALQDELVPRIVSTVADYYGILPHTISDALRRRKADDQLSPYEAILRAFSYFERITAEEHARVRQILESAARSAPDQGEIWAMLSTMYWHEHAFGFNPQPDPLGRALAAARRSVDVAPTNNLGHSALATTLFYQKNILAFRPAAERAIELNPMDGSNLATMGILMAYSGDWEHGCALVESALRLNPHHPGWYWFVHYFNAYRNGDYLGALSTALKFNMPGFFISHALAAAAYGQLGLHEPAQRELQELLAIRPDFAVEARKEFEKSYDPELIEHLIDGLCKAGLEVPDKDAPFPARGSME